MAVFFCFCCFFPGLRDQKPGPRLFSLTDEDVHFIGPRSLVAAADLAAVPASMVLRGVGDLKEDKSNQTETKNTTMT